MMRGENSEGSAAAAPWTRRRLAAGGLVLAVLLGLSLWAAGRHAADARLMRSDPDAAIADRGLQRSGIAAGRHLFTARCATCHGADARGGPSLAAPDLTDTDWLYGIGAVSETEQTIAYGIRSHHPKGWNLADMPAFARNQPGSPYKIPPLTRGDIADVVAFLAQRRGDAYDPTAAARGQAIFSNRGGCYDCHGGDGGGDPAIGAPNLVDRIWLYGDGRPASVAMSIAEGRHGVMPAFITRLSPVQIRQLALYVHSLSKGPGPQSGARR